MQTSDLNITTKIEDYPVLGTLAGCKVKGKQACNVCGKDTPHRWLKFSRKHVYMGNRKRLRPGHPYRRKKHWFDNTVESGTVNRIQSGAEIFESLKDFRNDFGRPLDKKGKRRKRDVDDEDVISAEEYEEDNVLWRWKKRSILFDLPYWKYMLVRHNIDVMHVEKNVSDALLSILMHSVKSKDGLKARQDLEDIGIRTNLHPEVRGKRTYLPPAAYWLSKEEKRKFCKRLSKFRGPDGYCANIANCVSVDPPNIGSLKSHDHHVLMQNLFPVTLRGLLPKGPRIAVSRLCNYFSRLCQRVIDPEKLVTLESEQGKLAWVAPYISDGCIHLRGTCSTDPEDKVHLCPLGPNASKIWVEVSKIDGARVWRPNSEIQVISDAVGNWVAWPNKHIVFM
ncbi:unnamed protein product [Arabidopsis arenosa]|uniref:Uncharacterized protein n=1 Tax=Arabidopsis arenosa TaxID=38785 RepID=A0A8S2ASI8_ARAAE|nr:unnamed protein product [Arabidopsis arenosa]